MSTVTSTSSSISSSIPETERESPLYLPVMACYHLTFIQNKSHLTLSQFLAFWICNVFLCFTVLLFFISFTVYTVFSVGFSITYLLKYFIDQFDRSHCYDVRHKVPRDCWYVRISQLSFWSPRPPTSKNAAMAVSSSDVFLNLCVKCGPALSLHSCDYSPFQLLLCSASQLPSVLVKTKP